MPGPGGHRGEFTAWDPVARESALGRSRKTFRSGAARSSTAGDVVFYGTMDGWFKAVDAKNGNALWQFKTGSGIIGQPITYRGPDGKQYVAVLSGVGGWAGAIVAGDLDPRDATRRRRLRQRDEGSAAATRQGRHAVCLRAAVSACASWRACSLALLAHAAAGAESRDLRGLRRPGQPAVLAISDGAASRTASRAGRARAGRAARLRWLPQRRGFVRKTLGADLCDVLIGVPADFEACADDAAYYRSSYVSSPARDGVAPLSSFDDPRLRTLRIGVQLIGDDLAATPPAHALARRGSSTTSSAIPSTATARRRSASVARAAPPAELDVALVWGPQAGYFARRPSAPARRSRRRAAETSSCRSRSRSRWACATTSALRDELDARARRDARTRSTRILDDYGVPRLPLRGTVGGARSETLPHATSLSSCSCCRRCRLRARERDFESPANAPPTAQRSTVRPTQPSDGQPRSDVAHRDEPTPTRWPRASGSSAGTTATAATPTAAATWPAADGRRVDLRQRAAVDLRDDRGGPPNGMPAFGGRIPDEQVWQIVAYVRSMSGPCGRTPRRAATTLPDAPPENERDRRSQPKP